MSRLDRQSFLGGSSDAALAAATVGFVGLGGGGSHVVQQCAHAGIGGYVCVDPDIVEDSNLNRLVGASSADAEKQTPKTEVAERVVRGLVAEPRFQGIQAKWQDATEALAECDIIVGGVDSFRERSELEAFCRRLMIPYIDMGMDVHELEASYALGGQVVLSSPGTPCLWCLGIINEATLELEAQRYGAAGSKPQVVWPNGVLASLATGLVIQLLVPWMEQPIASAYLEFDGNRHQVGTSNRLKATASNKCTHYLDDQTGDPLFDIRTPQVTTVVEPAPIIVSDDQPASLWRRFLRLIGLAG